MVLHTPQKGGQIRLPLTRKLLTLLKAREHSLDNQAAHIRHTPQPLHLKAVNGAALECWQSTELTETTQLMANEVDVSYAEYGFWNPDKRYQQPAIDFLQYEIYEDPIAGKLLFELGAMNRHPSTAPKRLEAAERLIDRLTYLIREQAAQDNLPRTQEVYL